MSFGDQEPTKIVTLYHLLLFHCLKFNDFFNSKSTPHFNSTVKFHFDVSLIHLPLSNRHVSFNFLFNLAIVFPSLLRRESSNSLGSYTSQNHFSKPHRHLPSPASKASGHYFHQTAIIANHVSSTSSSKCSSQSARPIVHSPLR